jgi:acetolactate synthase regulatory subunit
MQVFHIRYRNTQGTLMRILNAASRRGLDLPYVQAEALDHTHNVTLLLDVNPKQIGQLCRDWHAIVDVTDVRAGAPVKDIIDPTSEWVATSRTKPAWGYCPSGGPVKLYSTVSVPVISSLNTVPHPPVQLIPAPPPTVVP